MKNIFLSILLAVCIILTLSPLSVLALGVAVGPTNIDIVDALRGSEYKRTITVFNPSDEETSYSLSCTGDIENWISLHDIDNEGIIDSLTIKGNDKAVILVKINVPDEVTNGIYSTTIFAETIPDDNSEDTEVSAVLQAKTLVTVTVGGEEIISGSVIDIRTRDTETGLPFRIEVIFKNTGNVIATPTIECAISTKDKPDDALAQLSFNDQTVGVEKQDSIFVEGTTENLTTGEYLASVEVYLIDELLKETTIPLALLPPGTLTKQGELISLNYDGQPILNSLIKIQGLFINTGQVDVHAKLIAEIDYDDVLIDMTESETILVPSNQERLITAYYKLNQNGQYTIRGYISYDGKLTSSEEVLLSVANDELLPIQEQNSGDTFSQINKPEKSLFLSWLPVIIIAIVLLVTGSGFLYINNRKSVKINKEAELIEQPLDSE